MSGKRDGSFFLVLVLLSISCIAFLSALFRFFLLSFYKIACFIHSPFFSHMSCSVINGWYGLQGRTSMYTSLEIPRRIGAFCDSLH